MGNTHEGFNLNNITAPSEQPFLEQLAENFTDLELNYRNPETGEEVYQRVPNFFSGRIDRAQLEELVYKKYPSWATEYNVTACDPKQGYATGRKNIFENAPLDKGKGSTEKKLTPVKSLLISYAEIGANGLAQSESLQVPYAIPENTSDPEEIKRLTREAVEKYRPKWANVFSALTYNPQDINDKRGTEQIFNKERF